MASWTEIIQVQITGLMTKDKNGDVLIYALKHHFFLCELIIY